MAIVDKATNMGTKPGGYSCQGPKIGQRNIEFRFRRIFVGKATPLPRDYIIRFAFSPTLVNLTFRNQ